MLTPTLWRDLAGKPKGHSIVAKLSIKPIGEIREALAKLANQPREGKVASMLRAISLLADDVRALVKNGYTYAEIADILTAQGLPISPPTLRSYMSRINAAQTAQPRSVARAARSPAPPASAAKSALGSAPQALSTQHQSSVSSAKFRPAPDSEEI